MIMILARSQNSFLKPNFPRVFEQEALRYDFEAIPAPIPQGNNDLIKQSN